MTLRYLRNGELQEAKVKVSGRVAAKTDGQYRNERLAGTTFGDIREDSPMYGRLRGVLVVNAKPGTRAWQSGLRSGDIITSVNQTATPSLKSFLGIVNDYKGQLLLRVVRGNRAVFIVIR